MTMQAGGKRSGMPDGDYSKEVATLYSVGVFWSYATSDLCALPQAPSRNSLSDVAFYPGWKEKTSRWNLLAGSLLQV